MLRCDAHLVDQDRVTRHHLADAGRKPGGLDRTGAARARFGRPPALADLASSGGDRGATGRDAVCVGAGHRLGERGQGGRGIGRDGQFGGIAAHRIAGVERILGQVDHRRVRPHRIGRGNPRHVAIQHQDHVGAPDMGRGFIVQMHRMVVGQAKIARDVRHHPDRLGICEVAQLPRRVGRAADVGGDDQRVLGAGQKLGGAPNLLRVGVANATRRGPRRRRRGRRRRRQHLARYGQIDRPLGCRAGEADRPVDDHLGLLGHAQFVVPFDQLAQHAGLVEHLLRLVDVAAARALGHAAVFGQRRAPGEQQQGNVHAIGVDQPANRVRGADIDV